MKNQYTPVAFSMYLNYVIQGISSIILAQNMDFLTEQLNTNTAGVATVISGMGIGKLLVLFVSGYLSDKFGRKPFVLLGVFSYMIFFAGILLSTNVTMAFILTVIAGIANSFLDSGTYPALMEIYPKSAGTANIIVKAFVSAGQFILPLIITLIVTTDLYYGYSFLLCIVILLVNALFIWKQKFPKMAKQDAKDTSNTDSKFISKPKFWVEGICLILIGFTCTTTFFIISIWMPKFGEQVAGMGSNASLQLISYYSAGSLIAVFITAYLVKSLIKPVTFVFVYPFLSLITLFILWLYPSPIVCILSAFIIGFTAAGGVLQLALTTMAELFPAKKGTITGTVYTMCSLAFFVIPILTGQLSQTEISNVILLNIIITSIGVLLAAIVNFRYKKIIAK